MSRNLSWMMAAALGLAMLAGCEPKVKTGAGQDLSGGMIGVGEMARRLNLRVVGSGTTTASLRDANNYVTLCGPPRSRLMVNGQQISVGDQILASKGGLLIDEDLVIQVRSLLRAPRVRPVPPVVQQQPPTPPRPAPVTVSGIVVIDPGHGGNDPGAGKNPRYPRIRTPSGTPEKAIALDVGLLLEQALKQRGVSVVMTRRDDRFVELDERAAISNRAGADLFVALHVNSVPSKPSAQGLIAYVSRSASAKSKSLAQAICRNAESAGIACRGMDLANYKVLVGSRCPAVLVEMGFLSNSADARRLDSAAHRAKIVAALADGITSQLRR